MKISYYTYLILPVNIVYRQYSQYIDNIDVTTVTTNIATTAAD